MTLPLERFVKVNRLFIAEISLFKPLIVSKNRQNRKNKQKQNKEKSKKKQLKKKYKISIFNAHLYTIIPVYPGEFTCFFMNLVILIYMNRMWSLMGDFYFTLFLFCHQNRFNVLFKLYLKVVRVAHHFSFNCCVMFLSLFVFVLCLAVRKTLLLSYI